MNEIKIDYLIIGAGITGITLCKLLRRKFGDNVLVLEKEDVPGGLCRTVNESGHILDIGGGHFFNTKHDKVFEYVFKYLPEKEFNYYTRVSKVELGESTIDYPVESNIWQLPMDEQIKYIISIVRNGEAAGDLPPHNYEQWIRWKLGDKICDEYMIPYNVKLWGVAPEEMDIDWLHKIPRVDVSEILKYCLEKKQDKNKFPAHIQFYYPKQGGFQRIYDALAHDELLFVKRGNAVKKLEYKDGRWIVNDRYSAKCVINTTPWCDLYEALGKPEELKKDFSLIKYNRIVVSLYERKYDCDWHWRYVPDMEKAYHREFYIHNFAADSKPDGMYYETNVKRFNSNDKYTGDMALAQYETDAAYPIPVIGHADAISNILKFYEQKGLFGIGRWGQHEYQNADVSMHEAMKFVESL
ncbi:protoporphyrinogen/coproporphyrinogen oxidase [Butyrivibrio fibrisolvens]|uniref:protoporphyrinogen/coproporphyrinogen oxidase n=1 Tax=Butyrivibrio fibrisolvens TaxID=831 RepID=UPI0003B6CEDA|nr:NAD(P)-binding protein [Butyrivibrio fibrisolvens]